MKKNNFIDRVLVAVDGSERSLETVHYLSGMPAMFKAQINLLHIFPQHRERYFILAEKYIGVNESNTLRVWEQQQRLKIEGYMDCCRQILLDADFHPEQVKISIRHCRKGIARDIVEEAGKGYDAVVLRRRGMSSLPSLVMGSVALKLFNGIQDVPLIFAGRQYFNNRVLIGVDRPEEAFRAVDFVGRMARREPIEVGLIYVLRRDQWPPEVFSDPANSKLYQDIFDEEIKAVFNQSRERLESFGIKPENIDSRIVKNAFSRAGAIVAAADEGNYSTIVIGRSRVPRANTFFIGRVSNKIIQIGPKQHFWIVN